MTEAVLLKRLQKLRHVWQKNSLHAYDCMDIETGEAFERCVDDITRVIREMKEHADE